MEDSSGSKANVALIRNLKKAGFDLVVFHYTRKELQLAGIPCYNIMENRSSLLFILSRIERYLRYYLKIKLNKPLERKFGFSFTLLNDKRSIASALSNLRVKDYDLFLTLSKGGSFRPHHAMLDLPELQSKWVAYIHDPYPMHWYPPPYPWYEPGHRQKEKFMKQVADRCFKAAFPSHLLLEWMGDKYEPFQKKGMTIPHQINSIERLAVNTSVFKLDSSKFNVVHAGNLIQGREPYGLLKGFEMFLENNPDARNKAELIFIGGQNYYSDYLNTFENETEQFRCSREKLAFDAVQYLQQQASVNIILEAKSEISPFLPGKFPHCITANKQILLLGPPKSESRRLLGEDYPYWAEIDEENKIQKLLERLFSVWNNDRKGLELNRPELNEYLSTKRLKKTIDNLIMNQ